MAEFFDPTPEQQNVILVNAATLAKPSGVIESCEPAIPMELRSLR